MGMLSVSREITPFWYEIHTFVLTVHDRNYDCVYVTICMIARVHNRTLDDSVEFKVQQFPYCIAVIIQGGKQYLLTLPLHTTL